MHSNRCYLDASTLCIFFAYSLPRHVYINAKFSRRYFLLNTDTYNGNGFNFAIFSPFYSILSDYCHDSLYDGGPYDIETSPLICRANKWTGSYMIETSVMKKLKPQL